MIRPRTWPTSTFGARSVRSRIFALNGPGGAVSGSDAFGRFLRGAIAGTSGLDIITIGDSNAGYGNMGWTGGFIRALNARGAVMYATNLYPGGNVLAGSPQHAGSVARTYKNATTGASPTANTIHTAGEQATQGDADALSLAAYAPGTTLKPLGEASQEIGFLLAADTAVNDTGQYMIFTQPMVASGSGKTFLQAGAQYTYRVDHLGFASGSGQFKLHVRDDTAGSQLAQSASFELTNNGSVAPLFATLDFTAPAADHTVKCGWAYQVAAKGPFAALFESVYRVADGFAVNNLQYYGGATSTTIKTSIASASTTFLRAYLNSIHDRQYAAAGTGKVAVWINFGINGGANTPTAATTIQDALLIVEKLLTAWIDNGEPAEDICFVVAATHPTTADGDESTSVTRMASIRTALDEWAADDVLRSAQVSVVNLEDIFSAAQVAAMSGYSGGTTGQAHLKTSSPNMYETYADRIIAAAMEQAPMPNVTEPMQVELRLVGAPGGSWGGGGGGGRVVGGTANPVYEWVLPDGTTQYTVTVGAKGTKASGPDWNAATKPTPGGYSRFGSVYAAGGGRGGGGNSAGMQGGDGANGGGAAYAANASLAKKGKSIFSDGYDGGEAQHDASSACPCAGGGGAGGAGQDTQSTTKGGKGGAGITDSWDGTSRVLSAGGPGGNGFNGGAATDDTGSGATGGRQGSAATSPTAGNYGCAGGGAGPSGGAADGIDGVVQIKYAGSTSRITVVSGNSPTTSTSAIPGYVLHTFATAGNSVVTFA